MGYESSNERWSPVQSVEKILLSVISMLAGNYIQTINLFHYLFIWISCLEPNDESGANVDAAKMWRENREEFNKRAEELVRKTLGIPPSEWGQVGKII